MKRTFIAIVALACPGLISCTHITTLGHKTGYDVNAEFSGDPIAPVSLNAGFEGRTFAAVPPREAIPWNLNFLPQSLPKGDVMSTLLELRIEKVDSNDYGSATAFDYVTSGATGLSADALAGADQSTPLLEANVPASGGGNIGVSKIAQTMEDITKSGTEAFKH